MVLEKAEHKRILSEIGLDPDKDYISDDDIILLDESVTRHLQRHGFDSNINITEIGEICEEILDLISELE